MKRLYNTGLHNIRDLGEYLTLDGKYTRSGRYIRSEVPWGLTDEQISVIAFYGIRTVLDLRSPKEQERMPNSLAGDSRFHLLSLPLLTARHYLDQIYEREDSALNWDERYIYMLEHEKDWLLKVFVALALSDSGVLIHCTTGKDRTGIVSALLLGCVSVADEEIIVDYMSSKVYLRHTYNKIYGTDFSSCIYEDPFLNTPPEAMEGLLMHIRMKYGSIPQYLKGIGVMNVLQNRIRHIFLN